MVTDGMRPIHPGEVLREELLKPLQITPTALAAALHVYEPRVGGLVSERLGITADMAIRLGRYCNTSAGFWVNLQSTYGLSVATAVSGDTIERGIKPLSDL